jgi:hypothetical protein
LKPPLNPEAAIILRSEKELKSAHLGKLFADLFNSMPDPNLKGQQENANRLQAGRNDQWYGTEGCHMSPSAIVAVRRARSLVSEFDRAVQLNRGPEGTLEIATSHYIESSFRLDVRAT